MKPKITNIHTEETMSKQYYNYNAKLKPRGRPFAKGNLKGKSTGTQEGDESDQEVEKQEIAQPEASSEEIGAPPEGLGKEDPTTKIIDSVSFLNGKNNLKIVLSQKKNRTFRIQIFLNDTQEIRPITCSGNSTALTFWNLLKGSLKQ